MCVKQEKDISTFSRISPSRVQSIVTDDEKKNNRQETKYRDDEKGEMLAVFVWWLHWIILSVSFIHDNMMLICVSIDEYGYINEMDMSRRRENFWRGEYLKKGEWLKNERKIGLHDNMLCWCCWLWMVSVCVVWSVFFSSAHDWQLGCYFAGLYFELSGFVVT